jgi:hypothetical protein
LGRARGACDGSHGAKSGGETSSSSGGSGGKRLLVVNVLLCLLLCALLDYLSQDLVLRCLQGLLLLVQGEVMLMLLLLEGGGQVLIELPHGIIPRQEPNEVPPESLHAYIGSPPDLDQKILIMQLDKRPNLP